MFVQDSTFQDYTLNTVEAMGIADFNLKYIIGLDATNAQLNETIAAIAYYNGQPLHSQPISVSMFYIFIST